MRIPLALAFALLSTTLFASDLRVGDIVIEQPVARQTPPGAKVGAGYLTLRNEGGGEDRLIGGSTDFSNVEIHEMSVTDGVMRMAPVADGLLIAPGESVQLLPGGFHIMFTDLREPLVAGERRSVRLEFAKGGTVEVVFDVRTIAETMKLKDGKSTPGAKSEHDMHDMGGAKEGAGGMKMEAPSN